MSNTPNKSIRCTVENCKYNDCNECFCTLDSIDVGTHEKQPSTCSCVDCNSFECKNR